MFPIDPIIRAGSVLVALARAWVSEWLDYPVQYCGIRILSFILVLINVYDPLQKHQIQCRRASSPRNRPPGLCGMPEKGGQPSAEPMAPLCRHTPAGGTNKAGSMFRKSGACDSGRWDIAAKYIILS